VRGLLVGRARRRRRRRARAAARLPRELFYIGKTATILVAMLLLVAAIDALSHGLRRLKTS